VTYFISKRGPLGTLKKLAYSLPRPSLNHDRASKELTTSCKYPSKVTRKLRESDEEMPGTGKELNHMINAVRRSKISFNFGQHYSIFLARTLDIKTRHPSWIF